MRAPWIAAVMLVLGLVGAGCRPQTSPAAASGPPIAAPRRVTFADSYGTIRLRVRQSFTLALGAGQWQVRVADPTVLRALPRLPGPNDVQGVFRGLRPGTTMLSATGTPACPHGTACLQLQLGFAVTVQVVPRA